MSNKPTQIPNNELDIKYLAEPQKPTLAYFYDVADKSKDGGMGEIFFCQDKRTKEFCVLKTFKTEKEDYENYFKQEAEFALSLEKHPNIVYTKTIVIDEGQNYMVMEFVGEDPKDIKDDVREKSRTILNEINEIKEISKEQVLKWALDFCEGMLYLISIGMKAHKDIKPSNLFITKNKTLKIGDFGITAIENKGGSPGYRAPEYFDNKAKLDIRSDIYAFGIVLHQIINGYNILNQTKLRTLNQTEVQKDENPIFPNPEEIESKYFIDIIRKCLQIEPNKRYQTIEEIRADLLTEAKKINLLHTEAKFLEMTYKDWFSKGYGANYLEQYEQAIKYFDEAIKLNPKDYATYINRGLAKYDLGHYKESIEDYNEAIKLDNKDSSAYYHRGYANVMLGNFEEAIKDFEERIKKIPNYMEAYVLCGTIKAVLGRYKEAIKNFNKAIELDSENYFAFSWRGEMFLALEQYEKAIIDYDEVIRLNPKDADAYYNRGLAEYYLKQYTQAIADMQKYIELTTDPQKKKEAQEFIEKIKKEQGLN